MPLTREGRGTALAVAVDLVNTWDELVREPDLLEGLDGPPRGPVSRLDA